MIRTDDLEYELPRNDADQCDELRKHLDKFRQDKDAKFRLILIESRIHRLARYYKEVKAVAPNFKYEAATASTLVS